MNIRLLTSLALIVVGLVLATGSGLAELIGLGDPTATFGWKQIVGLAVGLALLFAGIVTAPNKTGAPAEQSSTSWVTARRAAERLWPHLVVTALVAYAFFEVLAGDAHIPYDIEGYHQPLLATVQERLGALQVPAYNPFSYAGTPLLANVNSAWAYPPHLLIDLWLGATGQQLSHRLVNVLAVIHVWFAAVTTVVLVRSRGLGNPAAVFAGTFVVLAGSTVSQAQHLGMVEGFAWLPLAVLVVDRLRKGITAARVAALAVLFALVITPGFVPLAFASAVLLLVLAAVGPGRGTALAGTAGGVVGGGLLAAVAILPSASLLSVTPDLPLHSALPTDWLVTAVFPNAYGHWNKPAGYLLGAHLTNSYFYVGGVTLVVVPLALAAGRAVIPDALATLAMLVLTFGAAAQWVVAVPAAELPLLGGLHRPEMYVYVALLPLALVLARGLSRVPTVGQLLVAGAFLLLIVLVPWTDGLDRDLQFPFDVPRRELLALALAVGALVVLAVRSRQDRWAQAALAAVAVMGAAELATTVPDRYFIAAPGPAKQTSRDSTGDGSQVLAAVRSELRPGDRVMSSIARLPSTWNGAAPIWHLEDVNGRHPQFSKHLLDRVLALGSDFGGSFQGRVFPVTPRERPLLEELGVRVVVVPAAADPFTGHPGFRQVFADAAYHVHRVERPGPRAAVLDSACLRRAGLDGVRGCRRASVPARVTGFEDRELALRGGMGGTVTTGEVWYPGWSAQVDGEDAEVRRLGYLAVVDVPADARQLKLTYRVPGLLSGLVVSFLALALVVFIAVRELRRRRKGAALPRDRGPGIA